MITSIKKLKSMVTVKASEGRLEVALPGPLHPYSNRSLDDLLGEEWRGVPDYEWYEVSNLGRCRSLARFVKHRFGQVWVETRIMAQTHRLDKNDLTGEPSVAVRVAFCVDGKRHDLTMRRLIYAAFVQPELDGGVVINIDGDGWNNHVDNLRLVSNSEKGKRVVARGRYTNTLATIDRSQWPKTFGGYSRSKPIYRCNLATGEVLEEYPSIAEATRRHGWDEKSIIAVAKGRAKHYQGFAWRYK
jgi:hypothetical protein